MLSLSLKTGNINILDHTSNCSSEIKSLVGSRQDSISSGSSFFPKAIVTKIV